MGFKLLAELSLACRCPAVADLLASDGEAARFMSWELTLNLGAHPQLARLRFPHDLLHRLKPSLQRQKPRTSMLQLSRLVVASVISINSSGFGTP